MLFDQVGDDLGVRFGDELMILLPQIVFQIEIVLDDAVMNHDHPGGAVAMRVGVFFSGPAVRSPARMAHAVGAVERLLAQHIFKIAQLALGALNLQVVVFIHHRDSGRVIAAIFKFAQPIDDERDNLFISNVSNYSTHISKLQTVNGKQKKYGSIKSFSG
jgi:hypothetical protein